MDVQNEENIKTLIKPKSSYILFSSNKIQVIIVSQNVIIYINYFNIVLEVELKSGKKVVKYKGDWNNLPDLLLENIFSYLNAGDKYNASTTCQSWHSVFYLPYSWHTFIFDDTTLTRRKFNYYSGWQVSTFVMKIRIHWARLVSKTFKHMIYWYALHVF